MTPLLWLAVILGGASTQVTESPDPYGECPVLKAPALPNPDFEGWVSVEGPKCFITSSSLPLQVSTEMFFLWNSLTIIFTNIC